MRRIILATAVLGAALAVQPAPAATVKLINSLNVNGGAFNPDNSGFFLFPCGAYDEQTVGGSTVTNIYCSVSVFDGNGGSAFGNGILTLDFDPVLLQGSIKGTVGSIVVDLTWIASEVSTNLPYASAEVVPTPPQQATLQLALSRNGRINGTVSLPQTGTITGTNGGANASRYYGVMAKA